MSTSKSYPRDGIGNEIRKGDRLYAKLREPNLIVEVLDVEPAADITAPNGQSMPTSGRIVVAATIVIEYSPDEPLGHMFVLKQPDLIQVPGARLWPGLVKPS